MGGMRAVEWAAGHPHRVERLLAVATCAAATGDQIAWCAPQLAAIRTDPNYADGDYYGAAPGQGPHVGLGIARRIAQKMGGDVLLQSSQGAGSVFTLTARLPAAAAPTPAKRNASVSTRLRTVAAVAPRATRIPISRSR